MGITKSEKAKMQAMRSEVTWEQKGVIVLEMTVHKLEVIRVRGC